MPWRLAKSAACPLVGEATATSSASSGIAVTAAAMQSAWKREPTMPIFTLDIGEGAKIPVVAEVGQGSRCPVTGTTSRATPLVDVGGMQRGLIVLTLALGLACRVTNRPPPPPPPPPLP